MKQNFRMIDVGDKKATRRRAVATGSIKVSARTIEMVKSGRSPKGDILAMAEVAGIMAAKRTPELLPLCHSLDLNAVRIWFEIQGSQVDAFCEVLCTGKTGVEMEALVGVNVCLLTIYDLAKAVDPVIEINNIYLVQKEGGKSGDWRSPLVRRNTLALSRPLIEEEKTSDYSGLRVAVGTLSDRASQGLYEDQSGQVLRDFLARANAQESLYEVVPDETSTLRALIGRALEVKSDVIFLTGGTGISRRDITPEVVRSLAEKELSGFGELQRQYGSQFTKKSYLSRSSAYVVDGALVVLFPGSPKAVAQGLESLGDLIPHAVKMIRGEGHTKDVTT